MIFTSPQMFLFFSVYLLFLCLMICVDSFFIFWSIMEFSTLIFMGLSYSAFKNSFSSLLIFFIIQSYSAFMMLIFFSMNSSVGFTFSILLKLSMFPFYFWYFSIIPFFMNFMFLFSSTFFKIPSILIVYSFFYMVSYNILMISSILTVFFGALAMLSSNDLRFILISSSVVNNSWFMFSQMMSLMIFFIFFMTYSLVLTIILMYIHSNSSTSFMSYNSMNYTKVIIVSLLTLSGLPPFPLFYIKMMVVMSLIFSMPYFLVTLLLMFVSVLTLIGYLKHIFTILVSNYTNVFYFSIN